MPSTRSSQPAWVVPLLVVAAVVAAAVLIALLNQGSSNEPPAPAAPPSAPTTDGGPSEVQGPQQDFTEAERRDADDPLALGPVDAPVALVVFSDYQCGFCARWSHDTLPLMAESAEAGDLRIEWRDVNVLGDASTRAALASYAAAMQDAFWEYHAELFADGSTRSDLSDDALIALAGELGLDTEQFAADMDSEETVAAVAENESLGRDLGAFSTPSFILGGQPIVGAQPTEVFTDALDSALEARQ